MTMTDDQVKKPEPDATELEDEALDAVHGGVARVTDGTSNFAESGKKADLLGFAESGKKADAL